ncbi:MAG: GNAT family N-acetyltransferase [Lachnospiraceae bacterium]|nr:GNAT family N-acetyltransferase [Lachnospiraceae bacterium]
MITYEIGGTPLCIRAAKSEEYNSVRNFYYELIDAMRDAQYRPGWEKDIYPAPEFLQNSIEKGELFLGEMDGQIAACMAVNHEYNAGYKTARWSVEAADSELLVIHALGVSRTLSGRGIAKQMVQHVIDTARQNHIKTIRLDVLEGNLPAEKAYTKLGFQHRDTQRMFYEDTGWTAFKLFEYIL